MAPMGLSAGPSLLPARLTVAFFIFTTAGCSNKQPSCPLGIVVRPERGQSAIQVLCGLVKCSQAHFAVEQDGE